MKKEEFIERLSKIRFICIMVCVIAVFVGCLFAFSNTSLEGEKILGYFILAVGGVALIVGLIILLIEYVIRISR